MAADSDAEKEKARVSVTSAKGATGEKFLKKAEREACWGARDKFWACMTANGEVAEKCVPQRGKFEELCPPTWVTHFDRKFQYEKFKKLMYEEGVENVDKKNIKK